ncbi:hypothetical protein RGU12_20810 [Fredinandcohnia sp. QZ13]|uniref:hypothetical protein n=1 Tax=Fredinandcohnia sp. QZ13 TaxID=3073144 RepID=UPI0028534C28|nr:hypothetical protein [Fredinandcohnia sp. QZ13]MDR4889940.1 hypothetical protein [Fredinandcohnia sp. QZ13]
MYSTELIIEIITTVIGAWFTLQFVVCLVTILLGNVMVEHVETGVFRNTQNLFLKLFTFIVLFLLGLGPYIYKRLERFSWLVRRLLMLVITLVMGLLFMLIYYIIKVALHAVFL